MTGIQPFTRERLSGPRSRVAVVAQWLCALMLLGGSVWLRWPSARYGGEPDQVAYNRYAFRTFSYSDIAALYFRDQLSNHPRPYWDYPLEYPVGTGLLIYLLNSATTLPGYLLLNSLILGLCALLSIWLVGYFPHGNRWLLALSPAVMLYNNLNWDFWGILWMLLGLLTLLYGWMGWAGALLAMAVSTKFFPVVLLPIAAMSLVRARRWLALRRLGLAFVMTSLLVNIPLVLLQPRAWLYFWEFNQRRRREVNLWNLFDRYGLSTAQINALSALLLGAGLVALLLLQWRARRQVLLPASCAALGLFFFVNKVYSPQYSLWIAVLLASGGAPSALAVAWGAVDLMYFMASFTTLALEEYENAVPWFYQYTLHPTMVLREGMLLVVIGWAVWQMLRSTQFPPLADGLRSVSETPVGRHYEV